VTIGGTAVNAVVVDVGVFMGAIGSVVSEIMVIDEVVV
jgi:hypothetical protein